MHKRFATLSTFSRTFITATAVFSVTAMTNAQPGGGLMRLDADGDGRVSRDEFRLPERGGRMFGRSDLNGDGTVTRDEVMQSLEDARNDETRSDARQDKVLARFDAVDTDGNGVMTTEEARLATFMRLDADGDSFITDDEARAARDRRHRMRNERPGAPKEQG